MTLDEFVGAGGIDAGALIRNIHQRFGIAGQGRPLQPASPCTDVRVRAWLCR